MGPEPPVGSSGEPLVGVRGQSAPEAESILSLRSASGA